MRHALVDDKGNIDRFAVNIDPKVATRHPWRWLPVRDVAAPTTTNMQAIVGPTYSVREDRVEQVWALRDKSPEELDAVKEVAVGGVDALAFKVLLAHENRIRVLEGQDPITAQRFRNALKGML